MTHMLTIVFQSITLIFGHYFYFNINTQGIKHAIVRKDIKIDVRVDENNVVSIIEDNNGGDNTEMKKLSYVFRCGKVGPCDSLKEVLR